MDKTTESTNRLLRIIIALLLRQVNDQKPTLRQQIEILDNLGLKPTEIAEVLGRTNKYIHKELKLIDPSRKNNGKRKTE